MGRTLALLWLSLSCLTGCGGDDPPAAPDPGTPEPLEVEPLMFTPMDQPVNLLSDGDPIELWRAPQGGHVLLVGARVKGLESDVINLRARLRQKGSRAIVAEEARTVVMEPVGDGVQQTDRRGRSQVAHVPACPDYDAIDVVGTEHELELIVTELYADFSEGRATVMVVPTCMQTDAASKDLCTCECRENYTLGRCGVTR